MKRMPPAPRRRASLTRILISMVALLAMGCHPEAPAQSPPDAAAGAVAHRVIVEANVEGVEAWGGILNNVENLRKSFGPDTIRVELVAHGKSLPLLLKTNDAMKDRLEQLSKGGVVFAACENTMRKQNVTKEDLLPFVTTVDSGVAEVVRRQEEGWAYIKGGG